MSTEINEFIEYLDKNTDYKWGIVIIDIYDYMYEIATIDKTGHERHFKIGIELLRRKDKYELLANAYIKKLESMEVLAQFGKSE